MLKFLHGLVILPHTQMCIIRNLYNVNWLLSARKDNLLLTHWGRVEHICISNLAITGSDNGLSPGRRQAITRTNAGLGNKLQWNLNRNWYIFIQENAFESVLCETAAILSRPQCVKRYVMKFDCFLQHMSTSCWSHPVGPTVHQQWKPEGYFTNKYLFKLKLNSIEILLSFKPIIIANFCTYHGSYAAMVYTKVHSDPNYSKM